MEVFELRLEAHDGIHVLAVGGEHCGFDITDRDAEMTHLRFSRAQTLAALEGNADGITGRLRGDLVRVENELHVVHGGCSGVPKNLEFQRAEQDCFQSHEIELDAARPDLERRRRHGPEARVVPHDAREFLFHNHA